MTGIGVPALALAGIPEERIARRNQETAGRMQHGLSVNTDRPCTFTGRWPKEFGPTRSTYLIYPLTFTTYNHGRHALLRYAAPEGVPHLLARNGHYLVTEGFKIVQRQTVETNHRHVFLDF